MSPLSFDIGWTDCCLNTIYAKATKATNSVNFAPVTPEILWLICMGGECT